MASNADEKPLQFVEANQVLSTLAEEAKHAISGRSAGQTLVLAILAGAFITMGALFSILLATGTENSGLNTMLLGLGFSTGFFFVILSGAVLFTEVNVLIPARFLNMSTPEFCTKFAQFWGLAIVGNVIGAVALGAMVAIAHPPSEALLAELKHLSEKKMSFHASGTTGAWFTIILSGMLANWLVGMAAFFATMGRTIVGKYIPVLLAVSVFVAANFQHSPANVGYFALIMPTGEGPGWTLAIFWNLLPAAIGNIIGATLFVALPLHYAFAPQPDRR